MPTLLASVQRFVAAHPAIFPPYVPNTANHVMWTLLFALVWPALLPLTLLDYLMRSLRPKPRPPTPLTTSLVGQLDGNWDSKGGYRAGVGHYAAVWTRDSFFALMAPLSDRAQRLAAFADRLQRETDSSGHVPFMWYEVCYTRPVSHLHAPPHTYPTPTPQTWFIPSLIMRRAVRRAHPHPCYLDEKHGQPVMDANSQYVILVAEAFALSGDAHWLRMHAASVVRAMEWFEPYTRDDGLVVERAFGGWEDSLLLNGTSAYTNMLRLEALQRADVVLSALGEPAQFAAAAAKARTPLMALLSRVPDTVTVACAALWAVDPCIPGLMAKMVRSYPPTLVPNRWPPAPWDMAAMGLHLVGIGGYHRTFRWAWVGCIWAAALEHASKQATSRGDRQQAGELRAAAVHTLDKYEAIFRRDGTLHEVFQPETELPVARPLYNAEPSFSEAIGTFLTAMKCVHGRGPAEFGEGAATAANGEWEG